MAREADIHGAFSYRITLQPNTITRVSTAPGQLAQQIKLLSGGTLEIGGSPGQQSGASVIVQIPSGATLPFGVSMISGSGSAVVGTTFNQLYPMSINEIYSWNNAGPLYLWASSATCVVSVIFGRSAGTQ